MQHHVSNIMLKKTTCVLDVYSRLCNGKPFMFGLTNDGNKLYVKSKGNIQIQMYQILQERDNISNMVRIES